MAQKRMCIVLKRFGFVNNNLLQTCIIGAAKYDRYTLSFNSYSHSEQSEESYQDQTKILHPALRDSE
jgi:hypothetical protein